ncbi:MAG: hypothetical protein Q9170_004788 [Blastenia crenularia]
MAILQVHRSFTIKSGHLCYGELHNIWQGASAEPSHGLPAVLPKISGTVLAHQLDHNVPARDGTWNAFQLIDTTTLSVSGWFVAHESVDVLHDVDKILRISGSPYDEDSGSSVNDEKTAAESVLVINRYDWGLYDKRAQDVVGTQGRYDEVDPSTYVHRESAGIVDYAEAKAEVDFWKEKSEGSRDEEQRPYGIWMDIPNGEYKYGRFLFNEDHSAARSFLLFTIHTYFTRIVIAGLEQPLRKEETHDERFQRRLLEGFDFRGMETLNRISGTAGCGTAGWAPAPKPLERELLGPYDETERLLREEDARAILRRCPRSLELVDPWRKRVELLLNELLMSYLERYIVPNGQSFDTVLAAAEALTPQRHKGKGKARDWYLFQCLTQPHEDPVPEWDKSVWNATVVADRVRTFLFSRSGEERGFFENDDYISGLCRCLAFLLAEVLELASNGAVDCYRSKIMPSDIRLAIIMEAELFSALKFSRVYWDGSE